ncbi:DUF4381 domain-containing protein [Carboxylicivirga sp. RSCT41]|uniref:DUF4381 domain-containing protein n=1 Tax=Carboxylicivirga agarovorans TaxID=3417570 RepID=UPI003D34101A
MQETTINTIGELMEPAPVPFSFEAPGWYILLTLFGLLLIIAVIRQIIRYRKNKYRREAVALLKALAQSHSPGAHKLFKTLEILKRVAIHSYGREEQTALNGLSWLTFLERKNKDKAVFSPDIEKVVLDSVYRGSHIKLSPVDMDLLQEESITWIKSHHV